MIKDLSLKNYESAIGFLLGALFAFFLYIYPPDTMVHFSQLYLSLGINIFFFWAFFVNDKNSKDKIQLLTANIAFKAKVIQYENSFLLIKPNINNILIQDSLLTLFITQNNFEHLYAIAQVTNIQAGGVVQATIIKKLMENENGIDRSNIIIKPNINYQYLA